MATTIIVFYLKFWKSGDPRLIPNWTFCPWIDRTGNSAIRILRRTRNPWTYNWTANVPKGTRVSFWAPQRTKSSDRTFGRTMSHWTSRRTRNPDWTSWRTGISLWLVMSVWTSFFSNILIIFLSFLCGQLFTYIINQPIIF